VSPEITISPSEGENKFEPKKVYVSIEALVRAAPDITLAHLKAGTAVQETSDEVAAELMDLAKAFADAAKKS
jgi:hypothetical protein